MNRRTFLILGFSAFWQVACGKKVSGTPTTIVRDETKGLLFTWIDASGEFHVEESAPAVPFEGRDYVRVTDPMKDEGNSLVVIADLRNKKPDGAYPVHYVARSEFEGVGVKRKKGSGGTRGAGDADGGVASGGSGGGVIIYGASWCGPCHQAEAHLTKRRVPFVKKDIEEDPAAAREMQRKLSQIGKRSGSIPVIDVRGKILVGFDPDAVDEALAK